MAKYTITFKIDTDSNLSANQIEFTIQDLLRVAVLPTLNSELIPLTLEVKKSR